MIWYILSGSSVVNHEAKRAITNTMNWMNVLKTEVAPKLIDGANSEEADQGRREFTEIIQQVQRDSNDALEGCKRILLHQEIAAGTYTSVRAPIALKDFVTDHFGVRRGLEVMALCSD